jgi:hypothetical protein
LPVNLVPKQELGNEIKSLEILNRANTTFPINLLARRPDDTEQRHREGDPLIREALDHGKVLYELPIA